MQEKNTEKLFHYQACGLPNIFLNGGVTVRNTSKGEVFHIEQIKVLHLVIGQILVKKPGSLCPDEFRFLRSEMNFSRKSLGEVLDVSQETIKKWEAGDNPIQKTADACLRGLYLEHSNESAVGDLVSRINQAEKREIQLKLNKTSQGWSNCA